jgi:hypothetical protein
MGELFSYVDLEKRVPAKHPLRLVRRVVNDLLAAMAAGLRYRPSGFCGRCCCRGIGKLGFKFTLTMASYNLIRLPKLIEAAV